MNPPGLALDLRDIHPPPLPEFWPPAPGWWIAGLAVIFLVILVSVQGYRRYRRYQQRQQILAKLNGLKASYSHDHASEFVTDVSMLLRRVALAHYPRHRVAALFGMAWCRFLDETGGDGEFCSGAGQVLATGPYATEVLVDAEGLVALASRWVRKNIGVQHGH